MKQAMCKDLMGACDEIITGETAEEMGQNSKFHIMEKVQAGDTEHQAAIEKMMTLAQEEQIEWYSDFAENFDSLQDV